jgi:hypothetical protein
MQAAQKERPILFSGAMVRALLDGTKTQTRRIVKMPPSWDCIVFADWGNGYWPYRSDDGESPFYDNNEIPLNCPYGQPGDRLWVRETHRPIFGQTCGLIGVDYQADPREKWERLGDAPDCLITSKWTPSIHMRREYSRILLEITGVRVERLNEISTADAKAEGIKPDKVRQIELFGANAQERAAIYRDAAVRPYEKLWESINGAGSWDANPWVWAVEFKRVPPGQT